MNSSDSKKRRAAKIIGRLMMISGIALIVYLLTTDYSSAPSFRFSPSETVRKDVSEKGRIIYKSGNVLEIKNDYAAEETRTCVYQDEGTAAGAAISLKGKVDGVFDPIIKPFIKSDSYAITINTGDSSFCPEHFIPQYPSALRAYFYFLPRNAIFDGQTWETRSCGGEFICSYRISLNDAEKKMIISCSGSIKNTSVIMNGEADLNDALDGLILTDTDISCENSELSSSWDFSEKRSDAQQKNGTEL